MSVDWKREWVTGRVRSLSRQPAARSVFGAGSHRFLLGDRLSDTQLRATETEFEFTVPDEYRSFLLEVGNGGAGPGYGLFPLGQWGDTAAATRPWADRPRRMSQQFPHTEAWNLSRDERTPPEGLDRAGEDRWFADLDQRYFDPALIDGTLPLAHLGCAIDVMLVVTGERAGEIWVDDRSSDNGIGPLDEAGFAHWYLVWLETVEVQASTGIEPR